MTFAGVPGPVTKTAPFIFIQLLILMEKLLPSGKAAQGTRQRLVNMGQNLQATLGKIVLPLAL